ncbi:MAG: hypothetical protein ACXWID_08290 [Pyrinomonadaceae bacterium]
MKRRALLKLVLTLTLAFGALAPLADAFEISAIALADSATPITRNSDRAEEPVPMTDRLPWLIYVVLTSSTVALAWILLSLARNSRKHARPADQADAETND